MAEDIKPAWAISADGKMPAGMKPWAGGGVAPLTSGAVAMNVGFARDLAHAAAINEGRAKPDSALYRLTADEARSLAENLIKAVEYSERMTTQPGPSPHRH